jgi:hypothetical protein
VIPARALSRRSLLLGAAGAGASALAPRPAAALAALGAPPPPPRVGERALGSLAAGVSRIDLARNADAVAVQWRAPRAAHVSLSFRDARGRWSAWAAAAPCAHAPDGDGEAGGGRSDSVLGELVWSGGAEAIAIRSDRALAGVRLHLLDVSDGLGARRVALAAPPLAHAAALPLAGPVLAAGPGEPPIIARRAWARGHARPRVVPSYGSVRLAFVHHTENPNGYSRGEVPAMLRAIFAFHTYVNGWNDIGYNFAVDAFGRIFEARAGGIDEPVIGAQAGGYNYASTGIAVLGSFGSARISRAAHRALAHVLAWKLSLHGVPARGRTVVKVTPGGAVWSKYPANTLVPLPSIAGHRDADATECPGDALYAQLPGVRAAVQRLAPRPTRATLELLSSPAPAAATGAPGTIELTGTLSLLGGTPLAGAPVAIQLRSVSDRGLVVQEQTVATAQSDARGAFSASLPPQAPGSYAMSLRALYLGGVAPAGARAGAAVSAPLLISASAPAPTAPPAPAPVAPTPTVPTPARAPAPPTGS